MIFCVTTSGYLEGTGFRHIKKNKIRTKMKRMDCVHKQEPFLTKTKTFRSSNE